MERNNRSAQIIAIVALVASAVGISLGFAAFSQTLTIESSAEVKPSNFDVDFSTDGTTQNDANGKKIGKEGAVTPTFTGKEASDTVAGATAATITNTLAGAPKISGLHATFTAPGQKAVYSFNSINVGELKAFLREVEFNEVETGKTHKCTAKAGATAEETATQSLVDAACADISISVQVGSEAVLKETNKNDFSSHPLDVDASEPVVVTIEYAKTGTNGNRVDGDVEVAFGDIELVYKSYDAS